MGTDYTRSHAADLAANLPPDSCCGIDEDPLNAWTLEACLLALCEYHLHNWNWAHTEDAKFGRNEPQLRIPRRKREAAADGPAPVLMTVDEMIEFVGGLVDGKGEDDG